MNNQYKCLCCNKDVFFVVADILPNGHSASKAIMKCQDCDIVYNKPEVALNSRVQILSDMIDALHEENTKLVNKLKELKGD